MTPGARPGPRNQTIEAAGGVVWRLGGGGVQILVVHRPRYDDWTLPKGKLSGEENHLAAALREVQEETGLRCQAGVRLPDVRYRDAAGRPKRVKYWTMTAVDGRFRANDEVDECRWVPADRAKGLLTYDHDVAFLDSAMPALVAAAGGQF